ncbi:hypothetical protein E6C27_scaffold163G001230 [Cucumis melo var. makuwa]|uniref:Uncharacterized protein n=1 Tax=Cucumis melo var. makuwa TaxID=1194695 RepID=A0A5A7U327_CUCMM|nr:hypothetical protein E6C27_scaffold163G001230 [Cucumis melo var. makuwa]
MNFSSRIRGFFNLHLSNLDQHVLGAPSGHRRPDFRSYGSACCTCSGTCQRLGEGKGRGKLASDREGSVTCHMGTQFCFRVYKRSSGGVEGLGLQLAVVIGEIETFDGGLEDVVEEGVVGRPFGLEADDNPGDFREQNGEMVKGFGDLERLVEDAI